MDLAGGGAGAVTVSVAIDRRAWCRVETGMAGVTVESRDTLEKASGRDVAQVLAKSPASLAARVLELLGIETGARVVTQSRVPAGAGLGESSALAVAVAGAAATAFDQDASPERMGSLAAEAESGAAVPGGGLPACRAAVHGGALAVRLDPGIRVDRLAVDPARIEESLLLIDAGPQRSAGIGAARASELAAAAERVRDALVTGRFAEVGRVWAEEWEARRRLAPSATTPQAERIGEVVAAAGGAVRVCGAEGGRVLAVWAPPGERGPGPREAVLAAARAEGLRLFPARVDLRGLDVE